jgi:hypothetical protein
LISVGVKNSIRKRPTGATSGVRSSAKGSTRQINAARGELGQLWQGRFFHRSLRTAKEYQEALEYIHLNPPRRALGAPYKGRQDFEYYAGKDRLVAEENSASTNRFNNLPAAPF